MFDTHHTLWLLLLIVWCICPYSLERASNGYKLLFGSHFEFVEFYLNKWGEMIKESGK